MARHGHYCDGNGDGEDGEGFPSDVHAPHRLLSAIMRWYAVFKGRTPSVYSSWDDCNKEVYGFRCAKHASFSSVKKAIEAYASYLAAEGNQPIGSPVQPTSSPVQPTGSPVTRQAPWQEQQEQPDSSSARSVSTLLNTYAVRGCRVSPVTRQTPR